MVKVSDAVQAVEDFNVNRDMWADQSIYFGAETYISKVHDKEKVKGRIIGLSEYKFLVLEMPMIIGFRTKYPVGSTVVAKFGKDGTVYGFYAEILQTYFDPSPIMFLKYPREVESFEFRGYKRFSCNIPAHMTCGDIHYYCIIKDISAGGCLLTVKSCNTTDCRAIEPADEVSLVVNMCGFGEMRLECFIRNIQEDRESLSYGLQFKNSGVAYAKIEKYFEMLSD